MIRKLLFTLLLFPTFVSAQINADRVIIIGRNALYYEDYVLSIQYFNQAINARPWSAEGYFYRGVAKYYLEDFLGGEYDCSSALERNPFMVSAYQVRGLCRINLGKFVEAAEDYRTAVQYEPENQGFWQNLILSLVEGKEYDKAVTELDKFQERWPKFARGYALRAQVSLMKQDTLQAIALLDKSLELDAFDGDAWSFRAVLSLQQEQYADAETQLNKAIHLQAKGAGNYINRALARYHQDNWMGAMNDYDLALDIDPNNYLGHFNRGLLRAQVGEDNLGIEDFNFVLTKEPDNMIALFNRALLLDRTGDYRAAIRDITAVIEEYPEFTDGYQYRAQIRRKVGDVRGAEQDEFHVLKERMEVKSAADKRASSRRTRKQGNRDIEEYDKMVVADQDEMERTYDNAYRGRVQNRKVETDLMSSYVLSFYSERTDVKRNPAYHRVLDAWNNANRSGSRLWLTIEDSSMDSLLIERHFRAIANASEVIEKQGSSTARRFARALDYYQVQDYESALADLNEVISQDADFLLAYFVRTNVRERQIETMRAVSDDFRKQQEGITGQVDAERIHRIALFADLEKIITIAPDFAYAYYNRANLYAQAGDVASALDDYSRAIEIEPRLAEAYYNRGVMELLHGNKSNGIKDLSHAGELGLYRAYSLIKQYNVKTTNEEKE